MSSLSITPSQIRAAQAMLAWNNQDISRACGVAVDTIVDAKAGNHQTTVRTQEKIRMAFEAEGIEFTENDGVRRRSQEVEIFSGPSRFHDFADLVYKHLERNGGEVCISVDDEGEFLKYRKDPEDYRNKMIELVKTKRVSVRILAKKSKFNSVFADQRWLPGSTGAAPTAFYVFGDNLALISFAKEPAPHITLLKGTPFAQAYKDTFESAWAAAKPPPKEAINHE